MMVQRNRIKKIEKNTAAAHHLLPPCPLRGLLHCFAVAQKPQHWVVGKKWRRGKSDAMGGERWNDQFTNPTMLILTSSNIINQQKPSFSYDITVLYDFWWYIAMWEKNRHFLIIKNQKNHPPSLTALGWLLNLCWPSLNGTLASNWQFKLSRISTKTKVVKEKW